MTASENRRLRRFFGLDNTGGGACRLYLPAFAGPARLEQSAAGGGRSSRPGARLRYRGHTYADRDARGAAYVAAVLSGAVGWEAIEWQEIGEFRTDQPGPLFLFGSKSNAAADWATSPAALGRFCRFEFGREWSVRCADGRVYSIPAPDRLSREEYTRETDYGVIGRFQHPDRGGPVFLIAGLGGRATEGCAYRLTGHWSELSRRFGDSDFVVVLKFPPPVNPRDSEEVAAFDETSAGRLDG